MVTIKDIARECGVSAVTVSAVLNNKLGEVSPATRERVQEAALRLKYRPSAVARRLAGKRMNTIGIADRYADMTYWSSPYESPVLEGIMSAARRFEWDILYFTGHPTKDFMTSLPAYLDGRCDGMILLNHAMFAHEANQILDTGLPFVFIGNVDRDGPVNGKASVIDVDNDAATYEAVTHLVELGHTRIAIFQGIVSAGNAPRLAAYCRALTDAGIKIDDDLIIPSLAYEPSGFAFAKEVLSRPVSLRPTAIFCFNDNLAFAVMKTAFELGIRIPEQLSVVGFDDTAPAALSTPPLTTIRQPLRMVGERAVGVLLGLIHGELPVGSGAIVSHELVIRGSTSPPPKLT